MKWKILSVLVALMMCLGAMGLADAPEYLNSEGYFPIVKEDAEPITLTVLTERHDTYGGDWEDIWFWQWASENMNINFDVTQVLMSQRAERKNLLFAAGDLPDLILGMSLTPDELIRYGQIEGQLMPLNGYIDEYMPTLKRWFDIYPQTAPSITAPDGNIYTLPCIMSDERNLADTARLFINMDWLAEAGMEIPETLDDFTAMLRRFKEFYPDGIPFSGGPGSTDPRFYVLNALGYMTTVSDGSGIALRNGRPVIPCGDEDFIHYLETLKSWYDEGLMSRDFITMELTLLNAKIAQGETGVIPVAAFTAVTEPEEFQKYWAVKPLTSEWNDQQIWPRNDNIVIGNACFSANTKYPEVMARLFDFFYTDQGAVYTTFGPASNSEDTLGLVGGFYFDENYNYQFVDVDSGKYTNQYEYRMNAIAPCHNSRVGNYGHSIDIPDVIPIQV